MVFLFVCCWVFLGGGGSNKRQSVFPLEIPENECCSADKKTVKIKTKISIIFLDTLLNSLLF